MDIVRSPIYQQLHEILKKMLRDGAMQPGDQFLTEREIATRYGVSRVTANKVLSSLVSEGLLEFKKGIGSFVRSLPTQDGILSLVSFSENVRAAGLKPSSKVLSFSIVDYSEVETVLRDRLSLEKNESVFEVRRLRLINDAPMIIEHRFIVAKYCPGLKELDLENSLFQFFSDRYGLTVVKSDEIIEAVVLSDEEISLLNFPEKKAGFLVTTMGFLAGDKPLWWEKAIHCPDAFMYRCQVRPSKTGGDVSMNQVLTHIISGMPEGNSSK